MKILVTGSQGQLGNEFQFLAPEFSDFKFFFTDKPELDITQTDKLEKYIKKNKINCIINCAAYTAVDQAESDKTNASLLNATAIKNMAEIASANDALLIHFSTDYVFDGKNFKPYTENDTAAPKTIYGKTKLDGEIEVIFNAKRALIFRTSWLYSSYGNNFVKTILENSKKKKSLDVVYDQIGTPTYARDLARAVLTIIPKVSPKIRTEIYNYSNEGVSSWYDFAREIVSIAGIDCKIKPILTKDFPTPAQRPPFSLLNKSKVKKDFGIEIPYWKDSLAECLKVIGKS